MYYSCKYKTDMKPVLWMSLMTAIVYLKTQNISWIEFTNELVYLTAIKIALGFERKIVKVYTIRVQNNVKSVLQWIPVQYNQPQILRFDFLKFLKTDSLHEKIQLVTAQAHYWIVQGQSHWGLGFCGGAPERSDYQQEK